MKSAEKAKEVAKESVTKAVKAEAEAEAKVKAQEKAKKEAEANAVEAAKTIADMSMPGGALGEAHVEDRAAELSLLQEPDQNEFFENFLQDQADDQEPDQTALPENFLQTRSYALRKPSA